MKLGVFLSGTGSNFKAIAASVKRGFIPGEITLVASNTPDAPGLATAQELGLSTAVFDRSLFDDGADFAQSVLNTLEQHQVDFIALAGYLRKVSPAVIRRFKGRIINIHPALLPNFGGKGMFGMKVHDAVVRSGLPESGVTIHYVDEIYDHGEIIARRRVSLSPGETAESLRDKVLQEEHIIYGEVLRRMAVKLNKTGVLN